mmetsp:Transcript_49256/g.129559  ORF Transcript_49256/g.129559 Transcript_49256/m.129559 type:complete len:215 (-) Transcript_49256:577-1221(-)
MDATDNLTSDPVRIFVDGKTPNNFTAFTQRTCGSAWTWSAWTSSALAAGGARRAAASLWPSMRGRETRDRMHAVDPRRESRSSPSRIKRRVVVQCDGSCMSTMRNSSSNVGTRVKVSCTTTKRARSRVLSSMRRRRKHATVQRKRNGARNRAEATADAIESAQPSLRHHGWVDESGRGSEAMRWSALGRAPVVLGSSLGSGRRNTASCCPAPNR